MKKIVFTLAAFAALSLSASTVQDPPPTQVNIDKSCPAEVSAWTTNTGNSTGTYTKNDSGTHHARTTVTDRQGNQQTYTTKANTATYENGGTRNYNWTKDHSEMDATKNSNVSRIDVTCSPKE